MKHLILCLSLALPVWAQNIRIQGTRFESRFVVRHGHLHVLLQPFSQALGAQLQAAGEGYWASMQEGEAPDAIPAGTLQVGQKQIPLVLDTGDVFVPAEAYCQALGLPTTHDAGGGLRISLKAPKPTSRPARIPSDPESYFVTQYHSRYNEWAPKNSPNCGPACMAMVALAFGRAPQGLLPGDRQGLIQWCRQAMTNNDQNENRGTRIREVARIAIQLGLTPRRLPHFRDLGPALDEGKLVIVGGDTTTLGTAGGQHFILCVGRQGSDYIVNDPGGYFPTPGSRMSEGLMEKFFLEAIALAP